MHKFYFYKDDKTFNQNKVLDNFHNTFTQCLSKKDIVVEIKDLKKSPSNKQRAYVRGYICETIKKCLINDCGWDDLPNNEGGNQQVYEMLKTEGRFYSEISHIIKDKAGNKRYLKKRVLESFSNSKGDKKRLSEFIEHCLKWASENLGVVLETPEEWKLKRGIK